MCKSSIKIKKFGLIGYPLSHSFSEKYFAEKFDKLGLNNYTYQNFELKNVNNFKEILINNPEIIGLNVTIPYKTEILKYVDFQDKIVSEIQATNTLKIIDNKIYAYNTDIYGFEKSFMEYLKPIHKKALVLGTGGASKAVSFVLKKLKIPHFFVSRNPQNNAEISYKNLDKKLINEYKIIINTTPVGSYPNEKKFPEFPYNFVGQEHYFYDLIYNPAITQFLKFGIEKGATVCNGLKMLELQAEKSWEIWNKKI